MKKKVILFTGSVLAFALTFTVNLDGADKQSAILKANEAQASVFPFPFLPLNYPIPAMCPNLQQYGTLCIGAGGGCDVVPCPEDSPNLN